MNGTPKYCKECGHNFDIGENAIMHLIKEHREMLLFYIYYSLDEKDRHTIQGEFFKYNND